MSSVADKKRAKREATRIRTDAPRPDRPQPKPQPKHYQHDTGLSWLLHKKQITQTQKLTGERYGMWYRTAQLSDPNTLRSCLNDTPRGGSGSTGASTLIEDTVAWWHECRSKLTQARAAVSFHDGLILALDRICGQQLRPAEILPEQKLREELQASLRIALDMLERVR